MVRNIELGIPPSNLESLEDARAELTALLDDPDNGLAQLMALQAEQDHIILQNDFISNHQHSLLRFENDLRDVSPSEGPRVAQQSENAAMAKRVNEFIANRREIDEQIAMLDEGRMWTVDEQWTIRDNALLTGESVEYPNGLPLDHGINRNQVINNITENNILLGTISDATLQSHLASDARDSGATMVHVLSGISKAELEDIQMAQIAQAYQSMEIGDLERANAHFITQWT